MQYDPEQHGKRSQRIQIVPSGIFDLGGNLTHLSLMSYGMIVIDATAF